MLYLDANNWIKTGIEFTDGTQHFSIVTTRDGFSDWSVIPLGVRVEPIRLRLTRHSEALRIQYHQETAANGTIGLPLNAAFCDGWHDVLLSRASWTQGGFWTIDNWPTDWSSATWGVSIQSQINFWYVEIEPIFSHPNSLPKVTPSHSLAGLWKDISSFAGYTFSCWWMISSLVQHIPNASPKIPPDFRDTFLPSDQALQAEFNRITDHVTDLIFQ